MKIYTIDKCEDCIAFYINAGQEYCRRQNGVHLRDRNKKTIDKNCPLKDYYPIFTNDIERILDI
jgi:hypothetical protein